MEQPYDQPQYNQPNQFSGPNLEPSETFMKSLIEVEETLQKFEMETLRRKRLKIDLKNRKKEWVPMAPGINPVCNELGICEILGMIRGRATVIGRLTKKTDEEIMKDMFQFHRALIELFTLRADDWELDEELAKPLLETCIGLIEDIIFSCRGGFTAMNVRSSYSRHENASSSSDNKEGVRVLGMNVR